MAVTVTLHLKSGETFAGDTYTDGREAVNVVTALRETLLEVPFVSFTRAAAPTLLVPVENIAYFEIAQS